MNIFKRTDTIFLACLFLATFFYPISPSALSFEEVASTRIFDRNGYLLREMLSPQEGKGHWIRLDQIQPRTLTCTLAAEDKRFYSHHGIDWLAVIRALYQNISGSGTISGASTITQQVIRNLYHFPRNIIFKFVEAWYAIRLEHTLDKSEILEQYFNRIPFGNQTFGIEAAAQLYFGKSASDLSWAESAFLVSLPKSPTHSNPYKNIDAGKARQEFILKRVFDNGQIPEDEYQRALAEPLLLFPKSSPFNGPHFVDWVLKSGATDHPEIHSTLDLSLQEETEKIVRGQVQSLTEEKVTNAAVLVLENATGDILSMVGSSDYFDDIHGGQFNAALAKRQPGSALKPFTYALAFQNGYTPATVIPDVSTVIPSGNGNFTPRNYDNQFHGPVRARTALACSYNIPAVRIVQDIGVGQLLDFLHLCQFESLSESAEFYGHGLTLGNGEVTLFEITRAFAMFANHGRLIQPRFDLKNESIQSNPIAVSPQIAFLITDILSDDAARVPAFGYEAPISLPFPCAVKTGTSSDYRDNWTIGYTQDFTVGVWVGNFDNSSMHDISGVTGAGPIFREVMAYLHRRFTPREFTPPAGIKRITVCALSGAKSHSGCTSTLEEYFVDGSEPKNVCTIHDTGGNIVLNNFSPLYRDWLQSNKFYAGQRADDARSGKHLDVVHNLKIVYPLDNAVFKIDPNVRQEYQSIYFNALAPHDVEEIAWYLDERVYERKRLPFKVLWNLSAGKHRLKAEYRKEGKTFTDEVAFEVIP